MRKNFKHVAKTIIYPMIVFFGTIFFRKRKKLRPESIHSVLIVNLGLIGDGLLVTPLIAKAQRQFPTDCIIDMLITPSSFIAIKNNPRINHAFIYNAFWTERANNHRHTLWWNHVIESFRVLRKLRKEKYDMVINTWFVDQPLTGFLLLFSGAKCLSGFEFKYSKNMYDISIPFDKNKHIVDNLMTLLYPLFNGLYENEIRDKIEYYVGNYELPMDLSQNYILVSPFTSERTKSWRKENWYLVIQWLNENYPNYQVVLTGDKDSILQSMDYINNPYIKIFNLVGKSSFDTYAMLVKNAKLIVSVESSAMHLSSAFNIPIFILFSRIYNFNQFIPRHNLFAYSALDVECAECIYGCSNPICMDHKPEKVIAKLGQFVKNENIL